MKKRVKKSPKQPRVVFSIPLPGGRKLRVMDSGRVGRVVLVLLIVVAVALPASGSLAFAVGVVTCGKLPIETIGNSRSFRLPGDTGYGIKPSSQYACDFGFLEESGWQRYADYSSQRRSVARQYNFQPYELNFSIYMPAGFDRAGLEVSYAEGATNKYDAAHYDVTIDGKRFAVHQYKQKGEFCPENDPYYYCSLVGQDTRGNNIYRWYFRGAPTDRFYSYVTVIRGTYIWVQYSAQDGEAVDTQVLVEKALTLFNSLQRVRGT